MVTDFCVLLSEKSVLFFFTSFSTASSVSFGISISYVYYRLIGGYWGLLFFSADYGPFDAMVQYFFKYCFRVKVKK